MVAVLASICAREKGNTRTIGMKAGIYTGKDTCVLITVDLARYLYPSYILRNLLKKTCVHEFNYARNGVPISYSCNEIIPDCVSLFLFVKIKTE